MATSSLIDAHLESISSCAQTIAELDLPEPRIFTNALLHQHDITTLIRDTETHERALFTVPKPEQARRSTVFSSKDSVLGGGQSAVRGPRRNTAVAAVLGDSLVEKIKRGGGGGAGSKLGYREGGGRGGQVDVEVLLEGAEKLVGVYPIPGTLERIASLRQRHDQLKYSISHYEARATEQAEQLSKLKPSKFNSVDEDLELDIDADPTAVEPVFTEAELRREEEDIKELELKKQRLENKVTSMERDMNSIS